MQTIPSGVPNLVKPDLTKLDFPHLEQDIPKYFSAGVFHKDAMVWWESFLSNVASRYGNFPSVMPEWPLDTLKSTRAPERPKVAEPTIPDKIITLHKNQMESQPLVRMLFF